MWGATGATGAQGPKGDISIHTPHVGSDIDDGNDPVCINISIHTPHVGSDIDHAVTFGTEADFNPHSPCGERPRCVVCLESRNISIHTPHAGSDLILICFL